MNERFECFADAPWNRIEAARLAIGRAVNAEGEGEAAAILATIDPGGDTMAEKALTLLRAMVEDGEALTPLNIIMGAKAEHGNAEGEALTAFTLSCAAAAKKSATGTQGRDRPATPAPVQPPQKGAGEKRAVETAQDEECHRRKGNPRPRAESPAKGKGTAPTAPRPHKGGGPSGAAAPAPGGYVKLHRAMFDNLHKPYSEDVARLWLHAYANHKPGAVKVRGNSIPIPRGGVARGTRALAELWGWGRDRVRGFLGRLEAEGAISITRHGRILNVIIVRDYDKWQGEKSH